MVTGHVIFDKKPFYQFSLINNNNNLKITQAVPKQRTGKARN